MQTRSSAGQSSMELMLPPLLHANKSLGRIEKLDCSRGRLHRRDAYVRNARLENKHLWTMHDWLRSEWTIGSVRGHMSKVSPKRWSLSDIADCRRNSRNGHNGSISLADRSLYVRQYRSGRGTNACCRRGIDRQGWEGGSNPGE